MAKLRILGDGASQQAKSQSRGKLFEKLIAQVLRHYGYNIERIPNVNYSGMEIDIEGKHIVTGIPLYAECKCYESEIDAPKLITFYGKYMAKWRKDKRSHGLFLALPGINTHAKGFYQDNCESDQEITFRLYEERLILDAIYDTENMVSPDFISNLITREIGVSGDWNLLFTERGFFWIQYIIPLGGAIPNSVALFNNRGYPISDRPTLDYLIGLYPEMRDFRLIVTKGDISQTTALHQIVETEEIVEVNGGSTCFEYQFPASPEHFVGRQAVLQEIDAFAQAVVDKQISARGILFHADSGWGKSSTVLASVARLRAAGHFAVAIDSRSASSSQFILRAVSYALTKFESFNGLVIPNNISTTITGFDGVVEALLHLGQILNKNGKVLFLFFDQFENIFFLPDVLRRIRDVLFKIADVKSNIVLGFAWKTDLFGSTSEFPYQLRDDISGSSKRIALATFTEVETSALLRKLSQELRAPLRKDLEFFLSEFSQGYPWLLKKLCAHVKSQREAGVQQADIANSLLNVEQLFQEDLSGLSPEEEDVLRRIAKAAPISALELGEEFKPAIIQSLVNARLVISIGNKYDVYWDIFRDYLNSGLVPVQENYILHVEMGAVLNSTKMLTEANGSLRVSQFQDRAKLSEKSFYNLMHDIRLLGLAKINDDNVILQINFPTENISIEEALKNYFRDKLRRNRLVWQILKTLESKELEENARMSLSEVSDILATSSPYTSATQQTWRIYARRFANWMDAVDLAIFDSKYGTLESYKPGTEVRENRILLAKHRVHKGMTLSLTQYSPTEKVAIRLVEALQKDVRIDWSETGMKESTVYKALATLEALGFISRKTQSIEVLAKGREFVMKPDKRNALFAENALKIRSFEIFIVVLQKYKDTPRTLSQLAAELRENLGTDWKDGTAEVYTKVMLDWARHTGLAPGIFARNRKGPTKGWKKNSQQQSLFTGIAEEK